MDHNDQSESPKPWFKNCNGPHPFYLVKKIASDDPNCPPFRAVSFFPWSVDSLEKLWDGSLHNPEDSVGWKEMISQFSGSIAVGADDRIYILSFRKAHPPFCVKLPPLDPEPKEADQKRVRSVSWALSDVNHLEPLVLFSRYSVLYIFNVKKRQIVGYLRGHGGTITSLAVHPGLPHIFCTTSNDFSSRIYTLSLPPQDHRNNPHWPPGTTPSLAGAAHGLHTTEDEGIGIGRCVRVLMGGRSGGHRAAVLGAAFHSVLPLIATCGLDRVVKIWHIPTPEGDKLAREDKPLFSSSRIHKARVLSVTWLSHDVLLTHSAPAVMRRNPSDHKHTYLEEGTMVLWRWLGMDRFFPPGTPPQAVLRGCATDYQESSSFKLISTTPLPIIPTEYASVDSSPALHVYQTLYHDPLVVFIALDSKSLRVLNVTHLSPRNPPPFPCDETKKLRMDEDDDESNDYDEHRLQDSGWRIGINDSGQAQDSNENDRLEACVMGMEGRVIVGVGSRGTVWLWTIKG